MRVTKWILGIVLALLPIGILPIEASEAEIEKLIVEMTVHADKSIDVKETIVLSDARNEDEFDRNIDLVFSDTRYELSQLSVDNASYSVYNSMDSCRLSLTASNGFPQEGFTISYTLQGYNGTSRDDDSMVIPILGYFDEEIESFRAVIHFETLPLEATVSTDYVDSFYNEFLSVQEQGNDLILENTAFLDSYSSATLRCNFAEGTFAGAADYIYPVIIHQAQVSVQVSDEKEFEVTKWFSYEITKPYTYLSMNLDVDVDSYGDDDLILESCSDPGALIDTDYNSLFIGSKAEGSYELYLKYKVRSDDLDPVVRLELLGLESDCVIEDFQAEILFEGELPAREILAQRNYFPINSEEIVELQTVSSENKLIISSKDRLYPREQFLLSIKMSEGAFHRSLSGNEIIALIFAAAIAVVSLAIKAAGILRVKRILLPEKLTPVQCAYLKHGRLAETDMIACIYNWAAQKAISLSLDGKGELLIRKNFEPRNCSNAELILFDQLFAMGDGAIVRQHDLKQEFARDIKDTKAQLSADFRHEFRIFDKRRYFLKKCWIVLGMLPIVLFKVMTELSLNHGMNKVIEEAVIGFICLGLCLVSAVLVSRMSRIEKGRGSHLIKIVEGLILIALIAIISFALKKTSAAFTVLLVCLTVFSLSCAWTYEPLNRDGRRMMSEIDGMIKMIKTISYEELEQVLTDDPDYYRKAFAYAEVLGVLGVLEKKVRCLAERIPSCFNEVLSQKAFDRFIVKEKRK